MYQFDIKPADEFIPTPSWSNGANHATELQYIFFNETAGIMTAVPGRGYFKAEEREG